MLKNQEADTVKKDSTKAKILNIAVDMFAGRGFEKVTMREIAAAVNINAASIYNHFKSKNAILEYILKDYEAQNSRIFCDDSVVSLLKENPTPEGILSCMQLVFPEGEEEYNLKVLYVILQEQHRNPIVCRCIRENILRSEQYVKMIIGLLKELCVIRPDTDPDFWAKISSSLFYSFSNRMLLGIGDLSQDFLGMGMAELLRYLFKIMLGLNAVGGSPPD